MTPAARAAAAIEVLDRVLAGESAEKVLTAWARASRFAGSADRAAVRDLVFEALRCRRSFAALGGGMTGRGLVLGGWRAAGRTPWDDGPHAPPPEGPADQGRPPQGAEALDVPDWLEPALQRALGADYAPVMQAMRQRAPVVLRVNAARAARDAAAARLAAEGIATRPHPLAAFALEVTEGARKVQASQAYATGLVELQDAASQAVVEALPLRDGMRVLDLCAGGGGKTLAMAARARLALWAHDAAPRRMADLPARAARAGIAVSLTDRPEATAPYDLVLADAPCSGSGSWRRDPEGKWALTPDRLADLTAVQAQILDRAASLVAPGGVLAYATCSFLREENESQVAAFRARSPGWTLDREARFTPLQAGDGFFLAILRRA
ncbi:RsmB/NOP family class I SAM-dependent RNA methyltransferase [Rhodobacter sp. Har01]|uniref:RsmB/NOP family class I SAM-dependent RNA methyltransferase n=1 Tax=Rhodobacter sp. Har01 TaxID=2883999 RepID=UPI001D06ECD2|nr:RsmB/NOP family class I SAM-dependent RNA methyltransferase [Rhodobacter sp. Har01]MCB6177234.1 RsmB/NOP family class I SAM-dependent RNA methyltransferase [Rhodobacter sp. Har01]